MGRSPCCINGTGLKRGPWTPEEDEKLTAYIQKHGHGSWRSLPDKAGLRRCGKSCRLRWINYLRPDIKRGEFSSHEQNTIIQLHALLGNKWSAIASYLPKRTDNEIKNYWNTHIKKKLSVMGIDPSTHRRMVTRVGSGNGDPKKVSNLTHMAQWESARLEAEARLVKESSSLSSKPHQNHQKLQWRLPRTQRLDQPRCLDILKAWKRLQQHDGDDNAGGSSIDVESFQPNDDDQTWNKSSMIIGDDDDEEEGLDLIKEVSNMFFNDGNNDDENMNSYWDDVFNFVDY